MFAIREFVLFNGSVLHEPLVVLDGNAGLRVVEFHRSGALGVLGDDRKRKPPGRS